MGDFTINGKNVITQSGVAEPVLANNVTMGTGMVGTIALVDDAVTGAKIENNPTIAGTLTVTGKAQQKQTFMQFSTHQALVLGG